MSTPQGSLNLSSTLSVSIPATVASATYLIPVSPSGLFQAALQTAWSAGTGPNQINKMAVFNGSAAAAPATVTLTTLPCVDGSTGFTHVRAIVIANLDPVHPLLWDFTVALSQVFGITTGGSSAKITIQPNSYALFLCPLGTNGYVVTTNNLVTLDPASNTIAYAGIVLGD